MDKGRNLAACLLYNISHCQVRYELRAPSFVSRSAPYNPPPNFHQKDRRGEIFSSESMPKTLDINPFRLVTYTSIAHIKLIGRCQDCRLTHG